MKTNYSPMSKLGVLLVALMSIFISSGIVAHGQAVGFKPGAPFSEAYIAGNTLYVAGQQGPDASGKVTGTDITPHCCATIK